MYYYPCVVVHQSPLFLIERRIYHRIYTVVVLVYDLIHSQNHRHERVYCQINSFFARRNTNKTNKYIIHIFFVISQFTNASELLDSSKTLHLYFFCTFSIITPREYVSPSRMCKLPSFGGVLVIAQSFGFSNKFSKTASERLTGFHNLQGVSP